MQAFKCCGVTPPLFRIRSEIPRRERISWSFWGVNSKPIRVRPWWMSEVERVAFGPISWLVGGGGGWGWMSGVTVL